MSGLCHRALAKITLCTKLLPVTGHLPEVLKELSMRIDNVLMVLTFSLLLGGGLVACTSTNTLAAAPVAAVPIMDYSQGVKAYLSGNFKQALAVWTPLAEQGSVEAQYNLGHMYRKGQGVPQNLSTAVNWYTLAAEKGEAVAQFNLGLMYQNGEGVPKDNNAALKWLTLAAEQGHTFAQYNLGVIYARGRSDFTDYERAYMWSNLSSYNEKTSGDKIKQLLGNIMTAAQISKAEEMSSRCLESGYTDC